VLQSGTERASESVGYLSPLTRPDIYFAFLAPAHDTPSASTIAMAQSTTIHIAATKRKVTVHCGLFINNEFVPSADSTETIE
jgi:hypothetical protein